MSDSRSTPEEQANAFYAGLDPAWIHLEYVGTMSPVEIRMLGATR
jgi:hypothetical protein